MDTARGNATPSRDADFGAWVTPSLPAMKRVARRFAPGQDADDLVQDALERAWRRRHLYDPQRGSATAWLVALTVDQVRERRRTRARRHRIAPEIHLRPEHAASRNPHVMHGSTQDLADPSTAIAGDLDIEQAMTTLTERQHLAVTLYYFIDLPVSDVAQVMDCSPGTVKSTLFDARTQLRRVLGDDDDQ